MRLQRIYSSKLYVTSTRKDKIHAAMQDPINAELVQQLSDYLDDAGQAELRQAEAELDAQESADAGNTPSGATSGGSVTPSSSGGSSSPAPFTGDIMSDFGEDEFEQFDVAPEDMEDVAPAEDSAPAEAPVAETTETKGTPIKATSVIWTTIEDVVSECDTIQGTLNAREDTKGVTRLQIKDNELWVYYNDDSNLNDKMIEVIEVLNSTGYTYLKFNRLARSNNAIVFDIDLNYQSDIKTVKEVEDEA